MSNDDKRNANIDFSRVLCTLYIVAFWHFQEYTENIKMFNSCTYNICIAVLGCFFVISGYLNHHKCITRDVIVRKILRLVPLFWLSACTLYCTSTVYELDYLSLKQFVLTILLLAPLVNLSPLTLWFIIALLYFMALDIVAERIGLVKVLGLYIIIYIYIYNYDLVDYRIAIYYMCYILGKVIKKHEINFRNIKLTIIADICVILFVTIMFLERDINQGMLQLTVVSVVGSFSILILTNYVMGILKYNYINKLFACISYSSYCLYLFHRQFLESAKRMCPFLFRNIVTEYLVIVPIMICVCYCIQKIYDMILRRRKKFLSFMV